MSEIEVFLVVRKSTPDGYIEYQSQQPVPRIWLSSSIKRIIKQLVGEK